jgi:HEAT repeat protein
VRAAALRALSTLGDTTSAELVAAATDDDNEDVARAAIRAAATIGGTSKIATLARGLLSRHNWVRHNSATELAKNDTSAVGPLWSAFQKERDGLVGDAMADALTKARWAERSAIAWLVEDLVRSDTKTWFARTRLLAHLTGRSFGPSSRSVSKQERTKALSRWRRWWAEQPRP